MTTVTKITDEKTYRIVNRSQTDRTLLIEHPNRTNEGFKLVGTEKPVEETPEVYRFQTSVKAGETKSFTVKEERDFTTAIALTNGAENQMQYVLSLSEASPALKQKLEQAAEGQGRLGRAGARTQSGERRSATPQPGPGPDSQEPA